jgi:hypothetical protein
MDNIKDFPKVNKFYFTRRGKFKVLSIKGKMVTVEWQDNRQKVAIEIKDLKKRLIDEKYAGEPDSYVPQNDVTPRFMRSSDDDDDTDTGE